MSATRENKEALAVGDDTRKILFKRINELIVLDEGSTVWEDDTYGDSWIVGSATNGLVGTNTGTVGGGQQVVGASGRVQTVKAITNPGNTWRDRLRDTYQVVAAGGAADVFLIQTGDALLLQAGDQALLQSTAGGVAGSIDTSNFRIDLDTGETLTWRVSYNEGMVSKAKVIFDTDAGRTNFSVSTVTIDVSANGGSNWQTVTNGVETTLTNTGSDLRLRLTGLANGTYWKTADANGDEVPIIIQFS